MLDHLVRANRVYYIANKLYLFERYGIVGSIHNKVLGIILSSLTDLKIFLVQFCIELSFSLE